MKTLLTKLKSILTSSEKKRLAFLGIGVAVLSLLETFNIAMLLPLMGLFISPQKIYSTPVLSWLYHACGAPDLFLFVALLVGAAFVIFLLKSAYSIAMLYQQQKIIGEISSHMTTKVLRSYLSKPYSFHLMNNSSELFKNIASEATNCVSYLLSPIITIGSEVVILLGICLFLICVYPVMTSLVFVIFGSIALVVNVFFKKRIRVYSSQREIFNALMYKDALESLGAVKEIQMYDLRDYFTSRYFESTKRYTDSFVKFTTISNLPRYIFEIAFVALAFFAVLFGIYSHKSFVEAMPAMVVLGVATLRLLPSFSKIYNNVGYLHYGVNSLDIIYDILKEEGGSKVAAHSQDMPLPAVAAGDRSIRLENITFRYKTASHPIFEGLSVSFPLNSISAIAGETGSGKSTLIDMVTSLLTPQSGRLSYCGLPINQDNITQYRGRIGYVPQHIFLLDDSIAANIAFGFPKNEVDRKRVEYAVKIAQLGSFVEKLPDGIDSKVGEKGVRISGGQRQRIGIARAIYRSPEILILDEASSALDGHTESKLYESLKTLKDKMTIVLVTHRLATLEHADLVYVLERGKIVDSGSYGDLSARSPVFQKIANQKILSQENAE